MADEGSISSVYLAALAAVKLKPDAPADAAGNTDATLSTYMPHTNVSEPEKVMPHHFLTKAEVISLGEAPAAETPSVAAAAATARALEYYTKPTADTPASAAAAASTASLSMEELTASWRKSEQLRNWVAWQNKDAATWAQVLARPVTLPLHPTVPISDIPRRAGAVEGSGGGEGGRR